MRNLKLTRVTLTVIGFVVVFLLALGATSASLIWKARATNLSETEGQAQRFINGAETSINRSLLGVDVLIANYDELLGLSSLTPDSFNAQTANQLIHVATDPNLLVNDVALINAQEQVLASSATDDSALDFNLPAGFVQTALAQPISTLMVSEPRVSKTSADRVLYLARHIKFADGSKVLAVAELQVTQLTAILTQGVDINGLEVTLERSNGQLLASAPAQDQMSGNELSPALQGQALSSPVLHMAARLSGAPAIVVARPILYPGSLPSGERVDFLSETQ